MPDLTHWVLVNILGPLMLPIFALATLCMIAGAKPEPIVSTCVSAIGSALVAIVRMFIAVLSSLLRAGGRTYPPRTYPPRKTPPRAPRPSDEG